MTGSHQTGDCATLDFVVNKNLVEAREATVSLSPDDINIPNFVCVASRLKQNHPEWQTVRVGIFDSSDAADNYAFGWRDIDATFPRRRELAAEMRHRATYVIDGANGEYLVLRLMAEDGYQTRIDLPMKGTPRCRFEIAARCLLVVGEAVFPQLDGGPVAATVTVTGTINRDGSLTEPRVLEVTSAADRAKDAFASVALAHARTLRVNSSTRDDIATIRYAYDVTYLGTNPASVASSERDGTREVAFGSHLEMTSATSFTVRALILR